MEHSEANFGWIYYGRSRHVTGKSHFLPLGTMQTLCRFRTFTLDDMRHIKFTDTKNLFKSQLCRKCLELLDTRMLTC